MKKLKLHGFLGEKYGKEFNLEVDTVTDAIKLLSYQIDGFANDLKSHDWRITKTKDGKEIDLDIDTVSLGSVANEFNIYPAIAGAKNGTSKVIAGIGLVALAVATGGVSIAGYAISAGTIATVGIGVALAGLAVNLAPEIPSGNMDQVEKNPSAIFSGPQNVSGSGKTIPVIYGKKVLVGSIIVSSGISTERADIN